jgi:hypothetical protein
MAHCLASTFRLLICYITGIENERKLLKRRLAPPAVDAGPEFMQQARMSMPLSHATCALTIKQTGRLPSSRRMP